MEVIMRQITLLIVLLMVSSCRCVLVTNGKQTACGCSLFSDTLIGEALLDPNSMRVGTYSADTDGIKVNSVYGEIETK